MYFNKTITYINSLQQSTKSVYEIELKLLIDSRVKRPHFISTQYTKLSDVLSAINKIVMIALDYGLPSISQTINFIDTHQDHMFIKQLCYVDGVQDKTKKNFYTKKSLIAPIYLSNVDDSNKNKPSMKFAINEETVVDYTRDSFDIIRFRSRYSINFTTPPLNNWRLDLTLIKECKTMSISELKKIRDKLFTPGLTPENFLELSDWKYADKIELELEYTGTVSDFCLENISQLNVLFPTDLNSHTNLKSYDECITTVANLFNANKLSFKQLGANPIELNRKLYFTKVLSKINNFFVTEKINGTRTMLIIYPCNNIMYIINGDPDKFIARELNSDEITFDDSCAINDNPVILDTESIDVDGTTHYYVFDIISHFTHDNISACTFNTRLQHFTEFVDTANMITLHNKHFIKLCKKTYSTEISKFHSKMLKQSYEIDGLIFISCNSSYKKTLNYKWKSIEFMTIDFVAKKCPLELLGISPYTQRDNQTLYMLFSGIQNTQYKKLGIEKVQAYTKLFSNVCDNQYGRTRDKYYPIQFSPSSNPYAYLFWCDNSKLDNRIVELSYDVTKNNWNLYKIRDDRDAALKAKTYYGNYYKIAEHIWMNYQNPLTLKTLGQKLTDVTSYFQTTVNKSNNKSNQCIYFAQRKFNNYVKAQLIKVNSLHTNLSWFIDLCSGNGQDMMKYIECGFRNGVFTDIDRDALTEIIDRKYSYIDDKSIYSNDRDSVKDPSSNRNCKIFVKHLDMSLPNKTNIANMYSGKLGVPINGVPMVVCNFALHYVIPNVTKMKNFINFLNIILAPGGIFIFTAFNGKKIFDLLKSVENTNENNNSTWQMQENNKIKYSIKKKYTEDEFTGVNQKIDVLLPFSNGKYYTENLIDAETLIDELDNKKIRLIAESSFDMYLDKFKLDKPKFYNKMTEADKKYVSLYNLYVFHKDNKFR